PEVNMFAFAVSVAFAADPAAAPTTTPAAPPAAVAVPGFDALDLNKDAGLDKTEVAKDAKLTAEFATVDADKNGKLSATEFKAWSDKQAASAAPAK
ncbi:MAG: EF-hand domain-containing protein, partial [Myxococcota bacterium]